jgi:hypothetical protein
MRSIIPALAVVAVLGVAPPALAQAAPDGSADPRFQATTLDISATGEVKAAPDMATITLGVSQQAATAADAMQANAAAMARVIAALKSGGIAARDIETSSLNLAPQYVYAQNQPAKLTGYEASNQVTVTVRDLTKLGAAIDAVVAAGATNIGGVQFGLLSRIPAENSARLAAMKILEDRAALYAEASGYHIKRLVNLSEGATQPTPMFAAARRDLVGINAATPVETGELTVDVTVTGEFELTH